MSKLNSNPKVPKDYDRGQLIDILTSIDNQVNALAEGRMPARHYALAETPSSSMLGAAVGDIVWNSNATMQGTVGAQYVTLGWVCTTAGTPGIWRDVRVLTGQ